MESDYITKEEDNKETERIKNTHPAFREQSEEERCCCFFGRRQQAFLRTFFKECVIYKRHNEFP